MTTSIGSAQLAAAYANMLDQKARGEWVGLKGDIPMRIGPLPIPPGYRTLSDVCARWVQVTLDGYDSPAQAVLDAVSDGAVGVVLEALIDGHMQAFAVATDHMVSTVPATLWLHLKEDAGGNENAMLTMINDCMTGPAFEPAYVGCTAVVEQAAYDLIRPSRPDGTAQSALAARPWLGFSSVKAWLKHPVAATQFGDGLLRSAGDQAPNEKTRRRALHSYLENHQASISFDSLCAIRRQGQHKAN